MLRNTSKITLTTAQKNRVFMWNTILMQVFTALDAAEHMYVLRNYVGGHPELVPDHMKAFVAVEKRFFSTADRSFRGLQDYAVVMFSNMYGKRGAASNDFVANNDGSILFIREEMEMFAKEQANITDETLNKLIDKIEYDRNRLIAHYEGNASNYKYNANAGISMRQIPTSRLSQEEFTQLRLIAGYMFKYFHSNIMPRMKTSYVEQNAQNNK